MTESDQYGRMVLSIIMIATLHAAALSGHDYSISVQNATFETGSIDLLLVIKITPAPLTVLKIMMYNSAHPQHHSNFYMIEERNVTRVGDIGEKTSHVISQNEDQYVLSLVMVNPTENEKGDYCCQIYIAGHETPLFAQLKATKLVRLTSVHGESSTFTKGDPEAAIKFNISPKDTTMYWVKCFHSNNPDPSTHFYTFDRIAKTAIGFGELGTRTSHTIDSNDNRLTFSLFIQRPLSDDAGPYCCQVDAAGITEPITVVVRMTMAAMKHKDIPNASTLTTVTKNIVASEEQEIGPILSIAFTTPIVVPGIIIALLSITRHCVMRRRNMKMQRLAYAPRDFSAQTPMHFGLKEYRANDSEFLGSKLKQLTF